MSYIPENFNWPIKCYLFGTSQGRINPEALFVTFLSFIVFKRERCFVKSYENKNSFRFYVLSWSFKSMFEPPLFVLEEKCKCQGVSKHLRIDVWMNKELVWDPGSPSSCPGAATGS